MSETAAEIAIDLVAIPSVSSLSNRDLWQVALHSYRDGAGVERRAAAPVAGMSKTASEISMDLVAIPSVSSLSNRDLRQVALHSYRDGAGVERRQRRLWRA